MMFMRDGERRAASKPSVNGPSVQPCWIPRCSCVMVISTVDYVTSVAFPSRTVKRSRFVFLPPSLLPRLLLHMHTTGVLPAGGRGQQQRSSLQGIRHHQQQARRRYLHVLRLRRPRVRARAISSIFTDQRWFDCFDGSRFW